MNKILVVALSLLVVFGGCTRSYEIVRSADGVEGSCITVPPGSHLHEGEILRIVSASPPQSHGRLRPILGRVRVLEVRGDTLALVRVLEGTVENGVSAEEVE